MSAMKISEILKNHDKGFAFEFFPPKNELAQESFKATVEVLKKYNPMYTSMTYGAGGKTREQTREAVEVLLKEKISEVMPHFTCVGATKNMAHIILDGYKHHGIENIMALRGDPPQDMPGFDFRSQELSYGSDLVKFIKANYNFCAGIAVYPEGHVECKSLDEDMGFTKIKVDSGADFAVTQMFFDNKQFYAFIDRMKKKNINIPVMPGILPLIDVAKVKKMAVVCRATIPHAIEAKMESLRSDPAAMMHAGLDFTINQCRDLMKNGFTKLHFFTLNQPVTIKKILDALA